MQKAHLFLKGPLGKPSHFTMILSVLLYFVPFGLWAAMAAVSLTAHFYSTWCCDLDLNQSGNWQRAWEAKHQVSLKIVWADQKPLLSSENREPMVQLGELWERALAGGEWDGIAGKGPLVTSCIPWRHGAGSGSWRDIRSAVKEVGCPISFLP